MGRWVVIVIPGGLCGDSFVISFVESPDSDHRNLLTADNVKPPFSLSGFVVLTRVFDFRLPVELFVLFHLFFFYRFPSFTVAQ